MIISQELSVTHIRNSGILENQGFHYSDFIYYTLKSFCYYFHDIDNLKALRADRRIFFRPNLNLMQIKN